jgi:hypothetical protein
MAACMSNMTGWRAGCGRERDDRKEKSYPSDGHLAVAL